MTDRPSNKVARLIQEYDLEGFGDDLERLWTDEGDERMSLRDLADLFNERLLEARMREAGLSTLEKDVETNYRNLTSNEVSTGVRTDTRTDLEQRGIDIDELEKEFITYQAIRSYLKEWRGAEYEGLSDDEKIQKDLENIQRLLTRTRTVTEERVEKLGATDRLAIEDFGVVLDIHIFCQECGRQHAVAELFEQGGCDCLQE